MTAVIEQLEREVAEEAERAAPRAFSRAFGEWLTLKEPNLRPATLADYRSCGEVYARRWRRHGTDEIRMADVEAFLADLSRQGRSARTRQKHLGILRAFFRWCVLRGYAVRNPSEGIRPPRVEKHRGRALTPEQARDLLRACVTARVAALRAQRHREDITPDGPGPLYLAVLVAIYTGLRRRNVLGLRWGQVDLEAGRIDISAAEMKGRRDHAVPIHPVLAPALMDERARQGRIDPRGFVLGRRYLEMRRSFESALRAAGLPRMRWHDLRTTFASWIAPVAPYAVLRRLMAHSPGTVTLGYVEPTWDQLSRAVALLPDVAGSFSGEERKEKIS